MTVRVLGVRHHGPGSARAVVAALHELAPDTVLVEGPADADPLLGWVADAELVPPVALLSYAADEPRRAVFWPFAVFSPEWQALRWAATHGATARFCDLPSTAVLAVTAGGTPSVSAAQLHAGRTGGQPEYNPVRGLPAGTPSENLHPPIPQTNLRRQPPARDEDTGTGPAPDPVRADPIAALAEAGGYDDPERWWEDLVEQRGLSPEGHGPFDALTEAMAAVREVTGAGPDQPVEERREAYMRQTIREVVKNGAQRVAVVCGAWHAPALAGPLPPASHDAALLRKLPRRKSVLSWVPWTHSRLATASGYGAGITSPGWYHHLFTTPEQPIVTWLTRVAATLRAEDLPVSSAHVIEAVRLAETLAVLRERPLAGLAEVTEATRAVLVEGDEVALQLVTEKLVGGEALGAVPDGAPAVPLAADLTAQARRLRLRQEPAERKIDLDLRNPGQLDRSRLFHRLALLDIAWAAPRESEVRGTGTFRESWAVRWRPELAVAVVEASVWGTTVERAAAARLEDTAARADRLAEVTGAVERCLLADLPAALPPLLSALDARAAADLDVLHLMEALPALVRTIRYGDVRGTDTASAGRVADALAVRICAALPAAAGSLDDDGAAELLRAVDDVHDAVALRAEAAGVERWLAVLDGLAERIDVHGLLAGRCTRLVRDGGGGRGDAEVAARRFAAALSHGSSPAARAAFVEGFLAGGGLLLVHDRQLQGLLDAWLTGLSPDDFLETLPMLRRTFATFAAAERRSIGEQVRSPSSGPGPAAASTEGIDERRAAPAVARVAELLGIGA